MITSRKEILDKIDKIYNSVKNLPSTTAYTLTFTRALQFSVSKRTRLNELITLARQKGKTAEQINLLKQKRDLFYDESFKEILAEWVALHESKSRNHAALKAAAMRFKLPEFSAEEELSLEKELELLIKELPEVQASEDDKILDALEKQVDEEENEILAKLEEQAAEEMKREDRMAAGSIKQVNKEKRVRDENINTRTIKPTNPVKLRTSNSAKNESVILKDGFVYVKHIDAKSVYLPPENYRETVVRFGYSVAKFASSALKFLSNASSKLSEATQDVLEKGGKYLLS